MRYLLLFLFLLGVLLTSCAYNQTTIFALGNVDCYSAIDKPVDVAIPIQGNKVPVVP